MKNARLGWVGTWLCWSMVVASAAVAEGSPPDGGRAGPTDEAPAELVGLTREDTGPVGGLGGVGSGQPGEPECISPAEAKRWNAAKRGKPPKAQPPIANSGEFPECPTDVRTYVGAGHGAFAVGEVTAPISLPATRKQRKRGKKGCCYLIPAAPGRPNG